MNLLVIIDMINGFVNEGALADKRINLITPNIIKEIKAAEDNQTPIWFFKDEHNKNDEEFKTYPPHCLKGSQESEIIEELKPYIPSMKVVGKTTTNSFITPEFKKLIKHQVFDKITVCGCCTDICIETFVIDLLKYIQEHHLKTEVLVHENEVATFDGPTHQATKEHYIALIRMQAKGAKLVLEGE